MEAGSVLRAGPAAGHIVVTHTVCELVSMEMGQKALLHTKADLAVLGRGSSAWQPHLAPHAPSARWMAAPPQEAPSLSQPTRRALSRCHGRVPTDSENLGSSVFLPHQACKALFSSQIC